MSSTLSSCEAFAPATVANVAVGFDNLGFALNTIGDKVCVTKTTKPEVTISSITCENYIDSKILNEIPRDPKLNTCTTGLIELLKDLNLPFGFDIQITKGIATSSGLGGSSASAVAALLAANQLLKTPLTKEELLPYTITGEATASGARHADNVAPCLFGGLTLIKPNQKGIVQIPVPKDLKVAIAYPGFRLDTKKARAVLPSAISLPSHVRAAGHLAAFISSCYSNDLSLMNMSLNDEIIEPARAPLIPGFFEAKRAALDNHAIGCSISGAGPSVFALCRENHVEKVAAQMKLALEAKNNTQVRTWISDISTEGARILL